jgi:AcrR family transcriptional regulator
MSPRPKKVGDDAVFVAAARAMTRLAPGELTLAAIAAEAGVTAAALSQRFGSKRQLLVAVAEHAAATAGAAVRALGSRHRSPLAAVRAYAASAATLGASPAALARHLAYLESDLSDPALRAALVAQARTTRGGVAELLAEAVARGELHADIDVPRLARTLELVLTGAVLSVALEADGASPAWFQAQADAVLAPYITRRRTRPATRAS